MEEGRNQRLYINTLASSPKCEDYASVISGYLGKNWGFFLGIIYFIMIIMGVMMYSTAITNDSASFLYSFGVTDTILSENPLYGLVIIVLLVAVASRGEQILFKVSTGMVLTKLIVIAILGAVMIHYWNLANVGAFPNMNDFGAVNAVYASFFKKMLPARSCVEIGKLPHEWRCRGRSSCLLQVNHALRLDEFLPFFPGKGTMVPFSGIFLAPNRHD